jgi:hypothetical protein
VAHQPRRLDDRPRQLLALHRADIHDCILQPVGERPVLERAAVEVAAQGEDQGERRRRG